ncbi:unnamed protein product, partial [Meganyctiphanes norvegica]
MDWVPVLSQIKSAVQATCGDRLGAHQTQVNFSRQCPVVSQVRSLAEATLYEDKHAARDTQKEFLQAMSGILNGIPVIGHVKGGMHYALKDRKAGTASIKAANHTTAAITGGALGFMAAGPGGAIVGGIIGGTAADTVTTSIQYKATGKYRPEGILQPLSDPKNPGKWVDGVTGVLLDGISGK